MRASIPSIHELHEVLFNEDLCVAFLIEKGILIHPHHCSRCSSPTKKVSTINYRCIKKACRARISLLKGSFFSKNRLICSEALLIGYLWISKVSSSSMVAITGHSIQTIADYRRHFMQLVASTLDEEDDIIGGPGIIVQVDETKLGKRKYHRGHRVDGVWVLVGVEMTHERKVFIIPVPDRSANTLHEIIRSHVRQGSVIHTDMWKGYIGLEQLGFEHATVNHSIEFRNPDTGVNTNMVEGMNNGIKLSIPARNRTTDTVDGHAATFIWRRKHGLDLWGGLLQALKDIEYTE
jgi:hypothetical protein